MSDQPPTKQGPPTETGGSAHLPAAVRQRLEQVAQHAKRCYDKGDYDYAHDLYSQCVSEDPGNAGYLQQFHANLVKNSTDGKKSSFGGLLGKSGLSMSARGGVDKAAAKGKWQDAFTAGCGGLKKNPQDIGALQAMAAACGELGHIECQLLYLRWALDIQPTDIETNRSAAAVLATVKEYDQAIACWQRVKQQKPNDEESSKQIARLSVEKTIHDGGYNPELLSGEGEPPKLAPPRVADRASKESDGTPRNTESFSGKTTIVDEAPESTEEREERLLAAIAENPREAGPYSQLAQLYTEEDRLQDAERLLNKAVAAAQGAESVVFRELLEDVHLRRVHQQVEVAQRRVQTSDSPESKELLKRMTQQATQAELEVFAARAARSPGDTRLQFELGLRQKRRGEYREAIKSFQAARGDAQRAAEIQILLGECFQHIEQYKLALSSYEAAVQASDGSNEEARKLALYRTAVLAMGMKDLDRAEQRLTELAALDFSYRDVPQRLDKIAAIRKDT